MTSATCGSAAAARATSAAGTTSPQHSHARSLGSSGAGLLPAPAAAPSAEVGAGAVSRRVARSDGVVRRRVTACSSKKASSRVVSTMTPSGMATTLLPKQSARNASHTNMTLDASTSVASSSSP